MANGQSTLKGETAIVTGAGRGIGKQIAIDLATSGAAVGLISRTRSQLQEVADQIASMGGTAMVAQADVTDRAALEAAIDMVETQSGPVTIAVNNAAGDRPFGPVDAVDPDDWWQAQELHVRAAYIVMHKLIPAMRKSGKGRIINVASNGGLMIGANSSAYCVGKSTLIRLTEHVHAEIAADGLSAFAIHPGTIMTEMGMAALEDPEARKWVGPLVDHLEQFRNIDTTPELLRVGRQVAELASGRFDALAGRYLDLEIPLENQAAQMSGA